jgi:hypothetical protein
MEARPRLTSPVFYKFLKIKMYACIVLKVNSILTSTSLACQKRSREKTESF